MCTMFAVEKHRLSGVSVFSTNGRKSVVWVASNLLLITIGRYKLINRTTKLKKRVRSLGGRGEQLVINEILFRHQNEVSSEFEGKTT